MTNQLNSPICQTADSTGSLWVQSWWDLSQVM